MTVKRINLIYGGVQYSVGQEDPGELRERVTAALSTSTPLWLEVNQGEGEYRPAQLLITSGVDLAIIPIDAEDGD